MDSSTLTPWQWLVWRAQAADTLALLAWLLSQPTPAELQRSTYHGPQ